MVVVVVVDVVVVVLAAGVGGADCPRPAMLQCNKRINDKYKNYLEVPKTLLAMAYFLYALVIFPSNIHVK